MLFLLAFLLADEASLLSARIQASPRLPFERTDIRVQAAGLGFPSAVTMGADGLIYVLQREEKLDPVTVVDTSGKVLRSWGRGMFAIPHSIRIDPQGNVWTVDSSSSQVHKFTSLGEKLMTIEVGGQPKNGSNFNGATDIAFGPNGHLYISDGYGNARILEYTADGKLVRQWGSAGAGAGQFQQPHGIAIDDQGILYVADRKNGRLQRFTLAGKFLSEWTGLGMVTAVSFHKGAVWIGTQQRNEPTGADGWILKLDRNTGKVLGHIESGRGHHFVNLMGDKALSGARPDHVWLFRPRY
jgi:DNA-binding beta-propeller fold protein YncE